MKKLSPVERKELLAALRAEGFSRAWRWQDVVEYEKREGPVVYRVQVWGQDGLDRVDHSYNGTSICRPTEFRGRAGLRRAIATQRRQVHKTEAHWRHYHG